MSNISNKYQIKEQFVAVKFSVLHISKYNGVKFSASEKILYQFLYALSKNVDKVYPNVTYLCEVMGVERRSTMSDQIKKLEAKGLIEVIREDGKSNVFHVNEVNEDLCSYPDKIVLNKGTNQDPTRDEPVVTHTAPTQTVPAPLQQAPRPCEVKPSDSTFEEDMLATEPLVKPESYLPKPKQSLQGVSMEGFIAGQVFLDYSDFKIMFQKVNNISDKLSIAAQNRYAGHINEFTEEIPF